MAISTALLDSLELFDGCGIDDLRRVADASSGTRTVADGEVVCAEGDKADRWWIVVDGVADVTVDGLYVGSIGPGETIGELALLDGELRGATVTATTEMTLHEVDGAGFLDALVASPRLAVAMLRQLATRLRTANLRPAAPIRPATVPATPTREPVPATFDPRIAGYTDDPALHMADVRETAAVQWSDAIESFVVTRYADVHRLSRDRSLIGSVTTLDTTGERRTGHRMLINKDGEDHTRLRRLLAKVFTPRAVSQWQERAEIITERLLAEAEERDEIDVITDYALPLPAQVISEMLGMPQEDAAQLRTWSHTLTRNVDPFSTEEERAAVEVAGRDMSDYVMAVIAHKRDQPAGDLMTMLLRAEDDGDILDDKEVLAQVLLLYIAGHETTLNLIGNGVTHLFRFPDQLERLRHEPVLDTNAVEEVLRFESPAQLTRRIATAPVEVEGTTIPAGSHVTLLLASANRDPRKWGDTADLIDVGRPGANEHTSFGGGAHFCLGASLARLEGRVALPRLLRRFPRMAAANDAPAWSDRFFIRGVDTLPVTLR